MTRDEVRERFLRVKERGEARVDQELERLRQAPRRNAGSDLRRFVGGTSRRTGRQPDAALEPLPDDVALDVEASRALVRFNRRGDETS